MTVARSSDPKTWSGDITAAGDTIVQVKGGAIAVIDYSAVAPNLTTQDGRDDGVLLTGDTFGPIPTGTVWRWRPADGSVGQVTIAYLEY